MKSLLFKNSNKRIFKISSDSGGEIQIDVDPRVGRPSHFLFSLHKSGSVLLNNMARELANIAGEPFVDVPGDLFSKGIRLEEVRNGCGRDLFHVEGVCFGGFRQWPHRLGLSIPNRSRCVLLVRDPRDILVSLYFSVLNSHPIPKAGNVRNLLEQQRRLAAELNIDAYVLKEAGKIQETLNEYYKIFVGQNDVAVKIYRYEDVIFRKKAWITDLADWFGWEISRETIEDVARRNDIRPEKEKPDQHIRKVVPGDHREKLKPSTIESLNNMFQDLALPFGYDLKCGHRL